ncbi:MAG: HEAT repeat domain-containing protein [Planctomycetota bacterium]
MRNEWMFTFVSKRETQVTGERGAETLSPQVHSLINLLLENLDDGYFDVRASAAIALGKIGRNTKEIRARLVKSLRDKDNTVQESAALALGMINAVESADALVKIVKNKRYKRSLRCFAAIGLGLMRNPANSRVLERVYYAADAKTEVKGAALLGLGLLEDERTASTLWSALGSHPKEELRAFAATALANLGKPNLDFRRGKKSGKVDLVKFFEQNVRKKTTPKQVRRTMALALGTLGKDKDTVIALRRVFATDRDAAVRGFGLLSLALMKKDESNRGVVREILFSGLRHEKNAVVKGFASLAVGLFGDPEGGKLLLSVFNGGDRPDVRAAAAVGLGILKYRPALPDLAAEVKKPKDGGDARGYACVALGMIGDPAASIYLKTVLKDVNVPYLKWASATGLAVLGDRTAIPDILGWINDRNRITREYAIRSLAYFRDDTTIEPLMEQFKKERDNEVRSMIVVTLGKIADTSDNIPVLRRISRNVNWLALTRLKSLELLSKLQ